MEYEVGQYILGVTKGIDLGKKGRIRQLVELKEDVKEFSKTYECAVCSKRRENAAAGPFGLRSGKKRKLEEKYGEGVPLGEGRNNKEGEA